MADFELLEGGDKWSLVDHLPCFRCGVCCSKYQVRISMIEAHRIAYGLEKPWPEFRNTYLDSYYFGGGSFLIRQTPTGCVFLWKAGDNTTYCAIEEFKPSSCVEWSAGLERRECREGLRKRWGLTVGDEFELVGPEDRLREFYRLLEKLEGSPAGTG
ncbi:MAG: YkgJ family cysteine cluster protein [Dehalococcoidia bacterium]